MTVHQVSTHNNNNTSLPPSHSVPLVLDCPTHTSTTPSQGRMRLAGRPSLFLTASVSLFLSRRTLAWFPKTWRRRQTARTMSTTAGTPVVWCPDQQIYLGGVVPGASNQDVEALLQRSNGCLHVFGYGSLCWNPGPPDESALGHSSVVASAGHAKGYRRAWAQKSTDHRGVVAFPGIVCTLLKTEEVEAAQGPTSSSSPPVLTEGMIYKVPPPLAQACLAELDFREKGGYAREIIDVQEDSTGDVIQALLYRGTPDNPAFWPRVVWDLPLAATVLAVSVGPSGPNDVYLNQLDQFLKQHRDGVPTTQDDTCRLAQMTKQLQQPGTALYFLYGCGSNQHGQIMPSLKLQEEEDLPQLAESVLWCNAREATTKVDPPKHLLCGGGHSGLLTEGGHLYLWGWNEQGQCRSGALSQKDNDPLPKMPPLSSMRVETAALGFSHTLVIEKDTQRLFGMGDNSHGQIAEGDDQSVLSTRTPLHPDTQFIQAAAGVFHSAAITTLGELRTWGSANHGQCTSTTKSWSPPDGTHLVDVVCGRHHTAVVDDQGRIWTLGDNQHGQLGRAVVEAAEAGTSSNKKNKKKVDPVPRLVDGPLGSTHDGTLRCVDLQSGWSHMVARVESDSGSAVYGWGRSDKGQLGCNEKMVPAPRRMDDLQNISQIACGSESTYFVNDDDKTISSCGWNEHGNLGIDNNKQAEEDVCQISPLVDTARIVSPPTYSVGEDRRLIVAAGGAHFLVLTN